MTPGNLSASSARYFNDDLKTLLLSSECSTYLAFGSDGVQARRSRLERRREACVGCPCPGTGCTPSPFAASSACSVTFQSAVVHQVLHAVVVIEVMRGPVAGLVAHDAEYAVDRVVGEPAVSVFPLYSPLRSQISGFFFSALITSVAEVLEEVASVPVHRAA